MAASRVSFGFLWLCVIISTATAITYNESQLEEMYEIATKLYWGSDDHWDMSSGYSDMLGEAGMKVCFVEGPEVDALVLGEGTGANSSNVTLELQRGQMEVSLGSTDFTLAFWYSFRPVDFFAEINDTMACNLVQIGGSDKQVAITYEGPKEYNLKYKYQSEDNNDNYIIEDDQDRPNWEFEVNDTSGDITQRGWQWNHVALVYKYSAVEKLTAFFNGFPVNKTATTGEGFSIPSKLLLNVPRDGRPPCAPVGIDEVALWNEALSEDDILALRLHVGRNRSLDEPEPTTEAGTTPGYTTAGDSTAGDSTAGDTTPGDTTPGDTTADDTTAGDTTAGDTTASSDDSTLASTSGVINSPGDATTEEATESSVEGSTEGASTPAVTTRRTTDDMVTSTDGGTVPSTTRAAMTTKVMVTTKSPKEKKIINIAKNVTEETSPIDVADVINRVATVVDEAEDDETTLITDEVVDVLKKTSKIKPAKENSSAEEIAALGDYRRAFVNLFSTLLVKSEESQEETSLDANKLIDVMDDFLVNYVDDPTVAENESIFSDAIDIQLAPVDGSPVQMDGNTTIGIPVDAFGEDPGPIKILVCLLKRGLQDALEPTGDTQPTDIGVEYSSNPTWNISGPILVMRVSGQTGSVQLQHPVSFELKVDPTLGEEPACVFQDGEAWSGQGLSTVAYDDSCPCVTCETNHMTNFAVLMAVNGVKLDGPHAAVLSFISYIGIGLSLLCLVIALILFILLRELNSTRMGIVKNLCVALFFAQVLFVAGIETATVQPIACKAVAAMLHYFFLCVMAWMLANGIYLYQKVKNAAKPGSVVDLIYFCILGWGAPAIIVAITAGIDHNVYGTQNLCWLSVEGAGIWAFVGPAMVIIIFNAFVTFLTMKAFVSVKVFKDKSDKDKFKSGLRAVVVMLPILGLSWVFGLLAFGDSAIFFQYLFVIFNSLQGVFLFIFHVLLNDEVKGAMRRRFGKVGASGEENVLFNKIWTFSSGAPEKSTEMSSVTQADKKFTKPVYKN